MDQQVPKGSKLRQYCGDKIEMQLQMYYMQDNYLSFN